MLWREPGIREAVFESQFIEPDRTTLTEELKKRLIQRVWYRRYSGVPVRMCLLGSNGWVIMGSTNSLPTGVKAPSTSGTVNQDKILWLGGQRFRGESIFYPLIRWM